MYMIDHGHELSDLDHSYTIPCLYVQKLNILLNLHICFTLNGLKVRELTLDWNHKIASCYKVIFYQ